MADDTDVLLDLRGPIERLIFLARTIMSPHDPDAWVPLPHEADRFSNVYIDESSQTKHRYLMLGGLLVPNSHVESFENYIIAMREDSGLRPVDPDGTTHTLKWEKVKNHNARGYMKVISAIKRFRTRADLGSLKDVGVRCIIVDTSKKPLKVTGEGSEDIGYHKELYFLCSVAIAHWRRNDLFHVYPDRRETKQSLREARDILNRGAKKAGDPREWPFRRLWFQEPEQWQALQIIDVLIGAIAYRLNNHYNAAKPNKGKKALCDHIWTEFNLPDPFNNSPPQQPRFIHWIHRPIPPDRQRYGPQNWWR